MSCAIAQPAVYRHFPDRVALIEGFAARIERTEPDSFSSAPQTLGEWAAWTESGFRAGDTHLVDAPADAVLSADPRRASRSRRDRSKNFLDVVARSLSELSEGDVRRTAALLRVLGSVQTWLQMREEYGIGGAELGPLVTWALGILEREIRAGNLPKPPG